MWRLLAIWLTTSLLIGCSTAEQLTASKTFKLPEAEPLYTAALSQDAQHSILLKTNNTVTIRRNDSGEVVSELGRDVLPSQPLFMAVTADMAALVLASEHWITLWSITTNTTLGHWQLAQTGSNLSLTALAISRDGQMIGAGFNNGSILLLRSSGEQIQQYSPHQTEVTHLEIHPNNQQLLTAALDGTLVYWDINQNRKLHQQDLPFRITSMTSTQGFLRMFVSDALNKQVILSLPTLKVLTEFNYPQRIRFFRKARFDPNNQFLAVASPKRLVSIWDTTSAKEIAKLDIDGSSLSTHVMDLIFIDQQLVTLNSEGLLQYWPLSQL